MTGLTLTQLLPLLPELYLFAAIILLLLLGLYGGEGSARAVRWLAPANLAVAMLLLCRQDYSQSLTLLGGMVQLDGFVKAAQWLVLLGGFFAAILAAGWLEKWKEDDTRFEFPIVLLLAVLGLLLLVAAENLLSLYLALELGSLSLYVLAAFHRDSLKATEAGLKYFILGSLASGMLLFGASLLYGFTGSIAFDGLAEWLAMQGDAQVFTPTAVGALVGLIMVMVGFCFKVSAVPFHMWTPDVYEGAPTPVTAFFAMAPKVAALALFARVLLEPFGDWVAQWQQVIIVVSAGSMLVGAFGALVQRNIKRMLAYSSIGHVGYALMALATATPEGVQALLVYLTIYTVMSAGVFGCVMLMTRGGEAVEEIEALAGLSRRNPFMAAALAMFMFSLAGIPPLAGFFGKFYAFLAALESGLVTLAIVGVLSSVVAAYYYLRVVKLMYFDEESEPLDSPAGKPLLILVSVTALANLLFIFMPAPLMKAAMKAAEALSW